MDGRVERRVGAPVDLTTRESPDHPLRRRIKGCLSACFLTERPVGLANRAIVSESAFPVRRRLREHCDHGGDLRLRDFPVAASRSSWNPAARRIRSIARVGRPAKLKASRAREGSAMTNARTVSLLAAATVLSGWLAGAALERSAVGTPVWQAFGPEAWAHFSRSAVFGTGLAMDAVVGVAATVLMIAAAVSADFDCNSHRETSVSRATPPNPPCQLPIRSPSAVPPCPQTLLPESNQQGYKPCREK